MAKCDRLYLNGIKTDFCLIEAAPFEKSFKNSVSHFFSEFQEHFALGDVIQKKNHYHVLKSNKKGPECIVGIQYE